MSNKQPTLKPQDLLVALKIAIHSDRHFTYGELASELCMSTSEVHAAVKRAEISRLIVRSRTELRALPLFLEEFVIHGVQYAFPAIPGPLTRGMATGFAGPVLKHHLHTGDGLPPVWPDPEGDVRGTSLLPLYSSIPLACRIDEELYELLTLLDSIRGGAAREREIAIELIKVYIR